MKATNLKRIAVAGAISGALGLAAVGLGAGAANADPGVVPFVPGDIGGDLQSYLPLIESFADMDDLGALGDIGSIANLGDIGGLGGGQLQDLFALAGGF
jgi:hypothetical protein